MRMKSGSNAWSRLACIAALGIGAALLAGCATESAYVQPSAAGSGGYYTSSTTVYPAGSYYNDDVYTPDWYGWGGFGSGWPYVGSVGFGWGWNPGFGSYWPGFPFGLGVTSFFGFGGWPVGWYTAPWYTSNLPLLSSCLYRNCGRWRHGFWRYGNRGFGRWNHYRWNRGRWANRRWNRAHWNHVRGNRLWQHASGTTVTAARGTPLLDRRHTSWVLPPLRSSVVHVNRAAFARNRFVRAPVRAAGQRRALTAPPPMYRASAYRMRPVTINRIAARPYMPRGVAGFHAMPSAMGRPLLEARFAARMPAAVHAGGGFHGGGRPAVHAYAPMHFAARMPAPVRAGGGFHGGGHPAVRAYAPVHFAAPAPAARSSSSNSHFTAIRRR
ncbi:MAG TPA: hypothetical protein VF292_13035 [Rhodanobacteraceae bacterium]